MIKKNHTLNKTNYTNSDAALIPYKDLYSKSHIKLNHNLEY